MRFLAKMKRGAPQKKLHVLLVDLITGESRQIGKVPFIIGNSTAADWQIDKMEGVQSNEVHLSKKGKDAGFVMTPYYHTQIPMLVDGALFETPVVIPSDRGLILKFHTKLFGLCNTSDSENFLSQLNLGEWTLFDGVSNQVFGNFPLDQISTVISNSGARFENCAISLENLGAPGIWLKDLPDLIVPLPPVTEKAQPAQVTNAPVDISSSLPTPEKIQGDTGEFQCPICWLHFEGKNIKHISSHEELIGDPVLGDAYQRRFVPQKWDTNGIALDDFGITSPDTACPHCHERLPAGFGEFKQYIYSIVGAPSSGKSYYLAVLLKQLKRFLFHKFEISFMDQDPEYNIQINEVIQTLFSARSAVEGRIIKTDMRGGNYKSVIRNGREVDLPKPSIFSISQTNVENTDSSIVFYDNAGEHFLPSHSGAEEFQILHVAKASSLFFLYDPLVNIDIRHSLSKVESDQLKRTSDLDQQASILSQMNVKISRVLGKATFEKLETPLAILVGKCDVAFPCARDWKKIQNPIGSDNLLHHSVIDANSKIIRDFLNDFAPDIVATAEKISREIKYFPISSFGHKPKEYKFYDQQENIEVTDVAPDPVRIDPYMIEIPTLWALSKTIPDLIPES